MRILNLDTDELYMKMEDGYRFILGNKPFSTISNEVWFLDKSKKPIETVLDSSILLKDMWVCKKSNLSTHFIADANLITQSDKDYNILLTAIYESDDFGCPVLSDSVSLVGLPSEFSKIEILACGNLRTVGPKGELIGELALLVPRTMRYIAGGVCFSCASGSPVTLPSKSGVKIVPMQTAIRKHLDKAASGRK
jgi:hypothetical protein